MVGVSVQDADAGDTATMIETLVTAARAASPASHASRSTDVTFACKPLRQVSQNVAPLMELTPLDRGQRAEDRADGRGERLRAVDHEELRPFRIQPALDEDGPAAVRQLGGVRQRRPAQVCRVLSVQYDLLPTTRRTTRSIIRSLTIGRGRRATVSPSSGRATIRTGTRRW